MVTLLKSPKVEVAGKPMVLETTWLLTSYPYFNPVVIVIKKTVLVKTGWLEQHSPTNFISSKFKEKERCMN
jgi:hypothetical protein